MEFRGFSLTPQTTSFLNSPFLRPKMSGSNVISYPLTGHLDKPVKTKTWDFPKMSVALPLMPNKLITMGKITCVVGGFVGSKSQRNQNKGAKFPLDVLIRQEMEAILGLRDSSQRIGEGCYQKQDSLPADCSVVEELMASVCLASLEQQRCCRLSSECSVESSDSDFIVFDDGDCNEETADEEFEGEDDEDEEEEEQEETVIFEEAKKVRFNPVVKVHVMRVWDYASRAARVSSWMQAGRDRVRFAERVAQTEKILAPILNADHRKKILSKLTDSR